MNTILYQAKEETLSIPVEADRGGGLRVGQAREPLLGSTPIKKYRRPLMLLSNLLLAISLTGGIVYYWPVISSEGSYLLSSKFPVNSRQNSLGKQNLYSKLSGVLQKNDNLDVMSGVNGEVKKSLADVLATGWQTDALAAIDAPDSEFSIVIPKISASAKVIANVNAGSPKEYNEALREGVAHAAGSVLPGMTGTTYLFAHSTDGPWNIRRYNAIFYMLKELEAGDETVVFFEGKKYFYTVTSKEIRDPKNTELFSQKEEELLVLQTCWPPGTTKEVLLVTAKRKTI